MQLSFSTIWNGYNTNADAKAARDCKYRSLKREGYTVTRWVLKGQIREWASFGVPDGRMCDVYMLDAKEPRA